jgi:hypothetical protein
MAPDGTLYGIELLNADEQLRRDATGKLLIVNEATGEQVEFPLAPAKRCGVARGKEGSDNFAHYSS